MWVLWSLWPQSFGLEVKNHSCRLAGHLYSAVALILIALAAELIPPPPPPIAEVFVRVLVEFGRVWAAIWRLPAMVGVVDVSISLAKMARKER